MAFLKSLLILNALLLTDALKVSVGGKGAKIVTAAESKPERTARSKFMAYGLPTLILCIGLVVVGVGQYLLHKGNQSDQVYTLLDVGLVIVIIGLCLYGGWGFLICGLLILAVGAFFLVREGRGLKAYVGLGIGTIILIVGIILLIVNRKSSKSKHDVDKYLK
jgi:membrane-bound ClpP family serine protease